MLVHAKISATRYTYPTQGALDYQKKCTPSTLSQINCSGAAVYYTPVYTFTPKQRKVLSGEAPIQHGG